MAFGENLGPVLWAQMLGTWQMCAEPLAEAKVREMGWWQWLPLESLAGGTIFIP